MSYDISNIFERQTVLVVDDAVENIMILDSILHDEYRIRVATSGTQAIAMANLEPLPDLILLDVVMPDMDGFAVCTSLRASERTKQIPIIFVTSLGEVQDEAKGLELGAVDYITKPLSPAIVRARVRTHLALYDQNRLLELKVHERTQALELSKAEVIYSLQKLDFAQNEILDRLAQAAELHDELTGQHNYRVGLTSSLLATELGLPSELVDVLRRAAPLHDVGKIGIADEILLKPGRLTPEEFVIMQTHTTIGAGILASGQSLLVQTAEVIALSHHERWSGNGYPQGLAYDAIPIEGQIVGIADVFDALTHERPYKEAWTIEQTLEELKRVRGQDFAPELVDAFLRLDHQTLI